MDYVAPGAVISSAGGKSAQLHEIFWRERLRGRTVIVGAEDSMVHLSSQGRKVHAIQATRSWSIGRSEKAPRRYSAVSAMTFQCRAGHALRFAVVETTGLGKLVVERLDVKASGTM